MTGAMSGADLCLCFCSGILKLLIGAPLVNVAVVACSPPALTM